MLRSLGAARIWFQIAFTAGFIALLAWRVDIGDALATLPDANWWWAFPGLLLFSASKAVHTLRWRVFLGEDRDVPFLGLLGIFFVHNMANAVLLLRAGDVLRIQTTSQRYKIPRSELTATVIVVETLLDGLTFVLLVAVAFSFGAVPTVLRVTFLVMAGLALFGMALGLAGARWLDPGWLMRTPPMRWLSEDIQESATTIIGRFVEGLRTLREPKLAVPAIALSIVGWLLEAGSYMLFGEAFGLDLEFADYLLIMMVANFVVSIPITPSGIGVYEIATQELVERMGVAGELAAGYAIGIHLAFIIWITIVGLVSMWALKLSPGEIFYVRAPEPDEATP